MATATVETSRVLYAMREHWRQVWSELQGVDPDYRAVCCAYCTHVRSLDGDWGAIPPGINEIIHGTSRINLTHGICPACQPIVFPSAKPSSIVTVDTGQVGECAYPVG